MAPTRITRPEDTRNWDIRPEDVWNPVIERAERRIAAFGRAVRGAEEYVARCIHSKKPSDGFDRVMRSVEETCTIESRYMKKALADLAQIEQGGCASSFCLSGGALPVRQGKSEAARRAAAEFLECDRYAGQIKAVIESTGSLAKWRTKYNIPLSPTEEAEYKHAEAAVSRYLKYIAEGCAKIREYVERYPADGSDKRLPEELTELIERQDPPGSGDRENGRL